MCSSNHFSISSGFPCFSRSRFFRVQVFRVQGPESRSRIQFQVLEVAFRSSCSQMFFKIDVLKNFAIFTGRRFQHSCFPVNIAKFLKTAFFIEHLRWLLLSLINAKRYRNDLNWLCSTVFAVKFEHILQCLPSFSIHCSL